MKMNDLRNMTGMSQRQFAEHFGIPVGTLRNWEQGIASPPDYVFQMIFTSLRRDKMINVETIKFVRMLDDLAELGLNGFAPFEEATQENRCEKIFYDTQTTDGQEGYRIVLDACIIDDPECYHHDVISYYDSDSLEYTVRVMFDEESVPYISVELLISEDSVVIENGSWYFLS